MQDPHIVSCSKTLAEVSIPPDMITVATTNTRIINDAIEDPTASSADILINRQEPTAVIRPASLLSVCIPQTHLHVHMQAQYSYILAHGRTGSASPQGSSRVSVLACNGQSVVMSRQDTSDPLLVQIVAALLHVDNQPCTARVLAEIVGHHTMKDNSGQNYPSHLSVSAAILSHFKRAALALSVHSSSCCPDCIAISANPNAESPQCSLHEQSFYQQCHTTNTINITSETSTTLGIPLLARQMLILDGHKRQLHYYICQRTIAINMHSISTHPIFSKSSFTIRSNPSCNSSFISSFDSSSISSIDSNPSFISRLGSSSMSSFDSNSSLMSNFDSNSRSMSSCDSNSNCISSPGSSIRSNPVDVTLIAHSRPSLFTNVESKISHTGLPIYDLPCGPRPFVHIRGSSSEKTSQSSKHSRSDSVFSSCSSTDSTFTNSSKQSTSAIRVVIPPFKSVRVEPLVSPGSVWGENGQHQIQLENHLIEGGDAEKFAQSSPNDSIRSSFFTESSHPTIPSRPLVVRLAIPRSPSRSDSVPDSHILSKKDRPVLFPVGPMTLFRRQVQKSQKLNRRMNQSTTHTTHQHDKDTFVGTTSDTDTDTEPNPDTNSICRQRHSVSGKTLPTASNPTVISSTTKSENDRSFLKIKIPLLLSSVLGKRKTQLDNTFGSNKQLMTDTNSNFEEDDNTLHTSSPICQSSTSNEGILFSDFPASPCTSFQGPLPPSLIPELPLPETIAWKLPTHWVGSEKSSSTLSTTLCTDISITDRISDPLKEIGRQLDIPHTYLGSSVGILPCSKASSSSSNADLVDPGNEFFLGNSTVHDQVFSCESAVPLGYSLEEPIGRILPLGRPTSPDWLPRQHSPLICSPKYPEQISVSELDLLMGGLGDNAVISNDACNKTTACIRENTGTHQEISSTSTLRRDLVVDQESIGDLYRDEKRRLRAFNYAQRLKRLQFQFRAILDKQKRVPWGARVHQPCQQKKTPLPHITSGFILDLTMTIADGGSIDLTNETFRGKGSIYEPISVAESMSPPLSPVAPAITDPATLSRNASLSIPLLLPPSGTSIQVDQNLPLPTLVSAVNSKLTMPNQSPSEDIGTFTTTRKIIENDHIGLCASSIRTYDPQTLTLYSLLEQHIPGTPHCLNSSIETTKTSIKPNPVWLTCIDGALYFITWISRSCRCLNKCSEYIQRMPRSFLKGNDRPLLASPDATSFHRDVSIADSEYSSTITLLRCADSHNIHLESLLLAARTSKSPYNSTSTRTNITRTDPTHISKSTSEWTSLRAARKISSKGKLDIPLSLFLYDRLTASMFSIVEPESIRMDDLRNLGMASSGCHICNPNMPSLETNSTMRVMDASVTPSPMDINRADVEKRTDKT
ncbi:hypothetical protein BSLG_002307 [Batrachochytrium salamandrivorans]|nr:hypothetical protein BSLG_002307 [Batrachochytrium salamandrivorans]